MIAPDPLSPGCQDFETTYRALRAQARRHLRREQYAGSMGPTLLVHEAWISLAHAQRLQVGDAAHYVRLVSRVMKNLLIDRARRRQAAVHGGDLEQVAWDDAGVGAEEDYDLRLAISESFERLKRLSPCLAKVVELRFIEGYTEAETGLAMGISTRSVRRKVRVARLRLLDLMGAELRSGEAADV